jgi:hypothetical protein
LKLESATGLTSCLRYTVKAESPSIDKNSFSALRRPSLRSQLNQIRLWVRQGRTDAWIAHKLDISVEELEQFKRDHRLTGEPAPAPEPPSIDFFPAPTDEPEEADEAEEPEEADDLDELEYEQPPEPEEPEEPGAEEPERDGGARRRRRGRRGGRRRRPRAVSSFEGTFDHGDEGYGLWLDPVIADSDVYADHWAGHREVTVTVEPDAITIRRSGE